MATFRLSVTLKAPEIVLLLSEDGVMEHQELQVQLPSYGDLAVALEDLTVKSVSGSAYSERCKKIADALIDKAFQVVDDLDIEQDRRYSFDSSVIKVVFEQVPSEYDFFEYTDEELLEAAEDETEGE